MYTWDSVRAYHLDFHQARILEGIDDSLAWKTPDYELKQYLFVPRPSRNTNSYENRNAQAGSNSSTPSTKVCSSGTRRKIAPTTASPFINAPTTRAIIPNAVVLLDQPHQIPIMQTPSRLAKDNSNPSTLWNSSQSHSLIPSLILQIHD